MKLAVAGDSAGEGLAKVLAEHLKGKHEVSEVSRTDAGPEPFYADLSDRVANGVLSGQYDRAILVCGTGIGVCISANKVPGIRAALTHDTYSAAARRPVKQRADHHDGLPRDWPGARQVDRRRVPYRDVRSKWPLRRQCRRHRRDRRQIQRSVSLTFQLVKVLKLSQFNWAAGSRLASQILARREPSNYRGGLATEVIDVPR